MRLKLNDPIKAVKYTGSKESREEIADLGIGVFEDFPFYTIKDEDDIFFIRCPATDEELEV